jgi:hypothetical protein
MVQEANQVLEVMEIKEAKNLKEVLPFKMIQEMNQVLEVMEIKEHSNLKEIQVRESFHNKEEIRKEAKGIQEETEEVRLNK